MVFLSLDHSRVWPIQWTNNVRASPTRGQRIGSGDTVTARDFQEEVVAVVVLGAVWVGAKSMVMVIDCGVASTQ